MNKQYASPVAEIISFAAMERLATLDNGGLKVQLEGPEGGWGLSDRGDL